MFNRKYDSACSIHGSNEQQLLGPGVAACARAGDCLRRARAARRVSPRAPAAAAPHRWRVWELDGSARSHDRAPSAPYISPRSAVTPHSAFNARR